MGRHQNRPLRPLTREETDELERIASSKVERVERIRRARAVLAVAGGHSFTQAARTARMRSSSGIAAIVQRFHERGMSALDTVPGAGRHPVYSLAQRGLILEEVGREMGSNPLWSLSSLEGELRRASNGAPKVSAKTIGQVLKDAGYAWIPAARTWTRNGQGAFNGNSAVHIKREAPGSGVKDPRNRA